ncbi:transglutaminase family protein [Yeosuana marina]|uniref:transglutaminase family protein n=1 Tax=Yeosuana marina TaxID=1565536 RepID=UPI0030C87EB3
MATFYIKHLTKYNYSDKVIDAANQIKLYPINDNFQKVAHQIIYINNTAPFIDTYLDFYNNLVGTFMIIEPHDFLSIESKVEVTTFPKSLPVDTAEASKQWNDLNNIKHHTDYIDFLMHRSFIGTQDVLNLLSTKDITTKTPFNILLELCDYIYNNFKYSQGITTVSTTLDELWEIKAGVCQDFTNVLLQMVRMLGIPARYVSGYVFTNDEITRGEGATHAWIEAYIPFYGWLGFDPTNNIIANENHIRLAVGKNYNDCSPVKGVFKGKVDDELIVKVSISTTKDVDNSSHLTTEAEPDETINSFLKNKEIVQQQQQQQQ